MTFKITNRPLLQFSKSFMQWKWIWIASTAGFGALALFYVTLFKQDMWAASQGLIIRDEANGAVTRLGRFASQEEMKAAQETVVEMARNAQVLSVALEKVGREPHLFGWSTSTTPPTKAEVDDLTKQVSVRAPKGAEFGTTEVIYIDVVQSSRERALALNHAICDALEERLKLVRKSRANGVIRELLAAKEAASLNLQDATKRLQVMEAEVGADLSDLRGLTDFGVNGSATRQTLESVNTELRLAELEVQQVSTDLQIAKESYQDPEQLLLTPTKLVNAHPGLKRLREGLATASINTSQLAAKFTDNHPLVSAARQTQQRIQDELRAELGISVRSLSKDLEIAQSRVSKLEEQKSSLESRIDKLATIRAQYGNVASEVQSRNIQLQDAERELAAAQAAREAAESTSLITRLDEPVLGDSPIGPGKSTILAGATVSGFLFGFGLIFLLTPLDAGINYGRRRQDYASGRGRRASDPMDTTVAETSDNPASPTESAENEQPNPTLSEIEDDFPTYKESTLPSIHDLTRSRTITEEIRLSQSVAADRLHAKQHAHPQPTSVDEPSPAESPQQSGVVESPERQDASESDSLPPTESNAASDLEILDSAVTQVDAMQSETSAAEQLEALAEVAEIADPTLDFNDQEETEESLAEAQAVIAAALKGTFATGTTSFSESK